LGFCWKNHQRHCPPLPGERKLYRLGPAAARCSRCGYTFHDFSGGSSTPALHLPQWLWFLKLFELWTPARDIAAQMGIAYSTALKPGDAPARHPGPGPGRQDAAPGRDRGGPAGLGRVRAGRDQRVAFCDVLPNVSVETLLHFKSAST
jgi:transposase